MDCEIEYIDRRGDGCYIEAFVSGYPSADPKVKYQLVTKGLRPYNEYESWWRSLSDDWNAHTWTLPDLYVQLALAGVGNGRRVYVDPKDWELDILDNKTVFKNSEHISFGGNPYRGESNNVGKVDSFLIFLEGNDTCPVMWGELDTPIYLLEQDEAVFDPGWLHIKPCSMLRAIRFAEND